MKKKKNLFHVSYWYLHKADSQVIIRSNSLNFKKLFQYTFLWKILTLNVTDLGVLFVGIRVSSFISWYLILPLRKSIPEAYGFALTSGLISILLSKMLKTFQLSKQGLSKRRAFQRSELEAGDQRLDNYFAEYYRFSLSLFSILQNFRKHLVPQRRART